MLPYKIFVDLLVQVNVAFLLLCTKSALRFNADLVPYLQLSIIKKRFSTIWNSKQICCFICLNGASIKMYKYLVGIYLCWTELGNIKVKSHLHIYLYINLSNNLSSLLYLYIIQLFISKSDVHMYLLSKYISINPSMFSINLSSYLSIYYLSIMKTSIYLY